MGVVPVDVDRQVEHVSQNHRQSGDLGVGRAVGAGLTVDENEESTVVVADPEFTGGEDVLGPAAEEYVLRQHPGQELVLGTTVAEQPLDLECRAGEHEVVLVDRVGVLVLGHRCVGEHLGHDIDRDEIGGGDFLLQCLGHQPAGERAEQHLALDELDGGQLAVERLEWPLQEVVIDGAWQLDAELRLRADTAEVRRIDAERRGHVGRDAHALSGLGPLVSGVEDAATGFEHRCRCGASLVPELAEQPGDGVQLAQPCCPELVMRLLVGDDGSQFDRLAAVDELVRPQHGAEVGVAVDAIQTDAGLGAEPSFVQCQSHGVRTACGSRADDLVHGDMQRQLSARVEVTELEQHACLNAAPGVGDVRGLTPGHVGREAFPALLVLVVGHQ